MSAKVQGWVWDLEVAPQPKLILLWLANRATDAGVCFPGQAEIRQRTGLSESMVRRYLHWLSSDMDESGCPKQPLVRIIHRPVAGQRHTSNVYVLLVPWAESRTVPANRTTASAEKQLLALANLTATRRQGRCVTRSDRYGGLLAVHAVNCERAWRVGRRLKVKAGSWRRLRVRAHCRSCSRHWRLSADHSDPGVAD